MSRSSQSSGQRGLHRPTGVIVSSPLLELHSSGSVQRNHTYHYCKINSHHSCLGHWPSQNHVQYMTAPRPARTYTGHHSHHSVRIITISCHQGHNKHTQTKNIPDFMDIRISSPKFTVMKVIMDCADITDINIISFYHVHSGLCQLKM
jgi:hypothetical protein